MAFHDVRFFEDWSQGARIKVAYSTEVVGSQAGHEQRFARYSKARRSYEIQCGVWSPDRLRELLAYYHSCQGRLFGFRFRDWSDYTAGLAWNPVDRAWETTTPAAHTGTGNGTQTQFQLIKRYGVGNTPTYYVDRKITRPLNSALRSGNTPALRIFFDGTEQTTGWSINYQTGLITFGTAPTSGVEITWSGMFDTPCRFDSDEMDLDMENFLAGNWSISIIEIIE